MQKGRKLDGTLRTLAISLAGAAVMAVVAMLIPVAIFETITGATGISELVPATAAPLGDTARAIIAFLFAASTFAVIAAMLLRRPRAEKPAAAPRGQDPQQAGTSLFAEIRARISAFVESRRVGPVITELSDLPKLRAGDAHPDAPPRRPISAQRDLADVPMGAQADTGREPDGLPITPAMPAMAVEALADAQPDVLPVAAPTIAPAIAPELPTAIADAVEPPVIDAAIAQAASVAVEASMPDPATADLASISALVDQLEIAVANRQQQLAQLEALATSQPGSSDIAELPMSATFEPEPAIQPPPLEIVPATTAAAQGALPEDDMDEALRSALATLQRMNARSR